jgi:molybdenum cofactor cytidylyltransferase
MISAIVLAAGLSRRMGRSKPLLRVGDKTMLQHVVACLSGSGVDEIVVVLGHGAERILPTIAGRGCRVVINRHYRQGMSSSIRRGLTAIDPRSDGVMIVPGDLPFLSPRPVSSLLEAFRRGTHGIVVPAHEGKRGHPVIFGRTYWPQLFKLRGDVGGREVLVRHARDVLQIEVGDDGIVRDIDHPSQMSG